MRSTRIVLFGLIGALGALLVSPMPPAQAQTPEYNVLDYGASNDGVTHTEAAINQLSATLNGAPSTLVFPGGTYLVCGALLYRSNQTWKFLDHATIMLGDGCVNRLPNTPTRLLGILQPAAPGQSNITFLHLAIDGNKSNNPTTSVGDGLELYDVSDVLVSSPRIENVPRNALAIGGRSSIPANIAIHRPILRNSGLPGVNGGSGLAIIRGRAIVVTGIQAAENQHSDIIIEANPSDPPDVVSDVQINGGVLGSLSVKAPGEGAGLFIYSNNGVQVSRVLISKVISLGNRRGFSVQTARDIQLQGGLAYRNWQEGFYMYDVTGLHVRGNRAIENSQTMANLYSGFFINAAGNLIESNRANDNQVIPTQKYGFQEGTGADSNTFVSNVAKGNASGGYLLVGPHSLWE
jgi:hypothetical protein